MPYPPVLVRIVMLAGSERDEFEPKGPWPVAVTSFVVMALASFVFFGFHYSRGMGTIGLSPAATGRAALFSWAAGFAMITVMWLRRRREVLTSRSKKE